MRIKFWGTRGSLPSPMNAQEFKVKAKRLLMNAAHVDLKNEMAIEAYLEHYSIPNAITFGGNTPCVEILEGDSQLILDCGSGLRPLGKEMLKHGIKPGERINILQTHTHWDHIMGFPFFGPSYIKGAEIHIHGVHPSLKSRFEQQMDIIHFPITIDEMGSTIVFHQLDHGEEIQFGPFTVTNKELHHPGDSYSYRITSNGKSVVFATDGEYTYLLPQKDFMAYVDYYHNADVLIFDAMYGSLEKTIEKENFGHSTAVIGVNISLYAQVKTLVLFHHDPESSDSQIYESFVNAQEYLELEQRSNSGNSLNLITAYDTLEIEV